MNKPYFLSSKRLEKMLVYYCDKMHFPIMMIGITATFPYSGVAFGRAFLVKFKSPSRRSVFELKIRTR